MLSTGAAALQDAYAVVQVAAWALFLIASVQLFRQAWWGFRHPIPAPPDPLSGDRLPTVTVQLPICNERLVAERVIRAAARLDWPRDRLDIQVLDDSDDDTSAIVNETVRALRREGCPIEVLRRGDRRGWKAGNLASGLPRARGDFLAVLDADFDPQPDFLRRLVPSLLADESVAFVQARWIFDNEDASLLTRTQALILHGLMAVEQARLSDERRALSFNGTGGVWRRSALEAAGGWRVDDDALTEDLDLSYRAALGGRLGRHDAAVTVATELPETMGAFRAQQARWVRGAGLACRALGRRVLSGQAAARERWTMLGHLGRHSRQPLLVALLVALPLVEFGWIDRVGPGWAWPVSLSLLGAAVAAYYGSALHRMRRPVLRALPLALAVLSLSAGLAPCLAASMLGGLLGRARDGFVRTPKRGDAVIGAYAAPWSWWTLVEIAAGTLYFATAVHALRRGDITAATGYAGIVATGLLWVGIGSLTSCLASRRSP